MRYLVIIALLLFTVTTSNAVEISRAGNLDVLQRACDISFVSLTKNDGEPYRYTVTGEIRNKSEYTFKYVYVKCTVQDGSGKVIEIDRFFVTQVPPYDNVVFNEAIFMTYVPDNSTTCKLEFIENN